MADGTSKRRGPTIRVTPEIEGRIAAIARFEGNSLAAVTRRLLTAALAMAEANATARVSR